MIVELNLTYLIIVWCILSWPLSFICGEKGYPRLSWFFTATFWLSAGYMLATDYSIDLLCILVIVFVVTAVLIRKRCDFG